MDRRFFRDHQDKTATNTTDEIVFSSVHVGRIRTIEIWSVNTDNAIAETFTPYIRGNGYDFPISVALGSSANAPDSYFYPFRIYEGEQLVFKIASTASGKVNSVYIAGYDEDVPQGPA